MEFNINNFIWLNPKSYESYLLNFFFCQRTIFPQLNKNVRKTFFFNFKNKRLKTYKVARDVH